MSAEHPSEPTGPAPDGAGRRRLISAERVQGALVFDQSGDKLGQIKDLMLDKLTGRVAYAIMAYGGFLGAGERYHPLPWSMLSYDLDKNGYVTSLTKSVLEGAPTLDAGQFQDEDDAAWDEAVHSHFGARASPFI